MIKYISYILANAVPLASSIAMKKKSSSLRSSVDNACSCCASIISVFVMVAAIIMLMAHIWGEDAATYVSAGSVPMSISSALAFIMAAVILIYRTRIIKNADDPGHIAIPVVSYILMLLMGTTILQNILHMYSGINVTYIFEYDELSQSHGGGPSLVSAMLFLWIGLTNIGYSFESGNPKIMQRFTGIVMAIIGVVPMVGYLANIPVLYYEIADVSKGMSLYSSVLFFLLGIGFMWGTWHEVIPLRKDS